MKPDDLGRHHGIVNALSPPPWASKALGDDPTRMLESIHRGLTVDSIATERAKFETCAADEALAAVIERNRSNAFDFLPVTEPAPGTPATSARIIGLLDIVPYVHGKEPQGDVRETMRPLSEENLIGADASIITFVRNADYQRCRLVISGPGDQRIGDPVGPPTAACARRLIWHGNSVGDDHGKLDSRRVR